MEFRHLTLTLSTIKLWNNLKSKTHKYKIFREKTRKYKTNVSISKIYMKQLEVIETCIQRISSNPKTKSMN